MALAQREIAIADATALNEQERRLLQAAPYHAHLHASAEVGVPLGRIDQLEIIATGSPYYVTGWDGRLAGRCADYARLYRSALS